jgi:hypothetical protein
VTVSQLRNLRGKIAVVAMVGLYRTGKSYLLNQLAGRDNAFQVRVFATAPRACVGACPVVITTVVMRRCCAATIATRCPVASALWLAHPRSR